MNVQGKTPMNLLGRTIKPYSAKCGMYAVLFVSLREEFGSGEYHLVICPGNTMHLTGTAGVELR